VDTALSLPLPLAPSSELARSACPADEAEWARAAASGDKAAFARLVEKHKQSVYGLCFRLLAPQGSADEARDAAQEAFVRAYTGIRDFDPRQPFAAWVLRIARNHAIDLLRRRRPTLALDARNDDSDGPSAPELPDRYAVSGEQRVQEDEAQRDLDKAFAALPDRYREVVALFHIQHKSYAEIAQAMNVPLGTVMTWLHRARKELKAQLAEHLS